MYNFEHEVTVKDRCLRHFLATDFFHDSVIHSIELLNELQDVQVVVSCHHEWAEDFDLGNGYTQDSPGIEHIFDEKYMYMLTFKKVRHLDFTALDVPGEYINGAFKDSAELARIKKATRKKHYHIRIQLAWGGYFDIIFAAFVIKRAIGKIQLPKRVWNLAPFYGAISRLKPYGISEIYELAREGDWPQRYYAIQYLSYVGDKNIRAIALEGLVHEDDEVKLASVFALGKHGDIRDLPQLASLWAKEDYPIFRRHIQDAIEKIIYRPR